MYVRMDIVLLKYLLDYGYHSYSTAVYMGRISSMLTFLFKTAQNFLS